MANPNGRKGAVFERSIADYLQEHWGEFAEFIDRRVKSGAKDKGDLGNVRLGQHRLVVECKNSVSYKDLSGWTDEAAREARNDAAIAGIVIHKRKGKSNPGQQYVTLTVDDLITILHAARGAA